LRAIASARCCGRRLVTTRSLLKEILEAAGYRVRTAADGVEALTALHAGEFDLLVSDVEMPRMDGFDLTARVRADPPPGRAAGRARDAHSSRAKTKSAASTSAQRLRGQERLRQEPAARHHRTLV
jgi:CheY-like chemotaxis protein